MRSFVLIAIMALLIGCSTVWNERCSPEGSDSALMYKIKRIRTRKTYYIIYASRNDSTFKIVSDKTPAYNREQIKVGKYYHLELVSYFPVDTLLGIPIAPNLGVRGIGTESGKIIRPDKKTHNKIYNALNLEGLYIMDKIFDNEKEFLDALEGK